MAVTGPDSPNPSPTMNRPKIIAPTCVEIALPNDMQMHISTQKQMTSISKLNQNITRMKNQTAAKK
jgi:hypothetical protein